MLGYRKSFLRQHVRRVGWKSLGKVVFPAGRRFSPQHPCCSAIPRVFLPDDDLFLTYTSLGTRPRGHSTSFELEITSWKPIFRGSTEMWRGDEHVGEWKIRSLSLSLSLWRQLWLSLWNLVIVQANNRKKDPRLTKSRHNLATSNCV